MRIHVRVPISIFNTGDFGSFESDLFERSNGRGMSLAPFLVVLLPELAALPGWVSRSVRSLYRIEPKLGSYPRIVCKESKVCVFRFCGIVSMLNGHLENERIHFLRMVLCVSMGL